MTKILTCSLLLGLGLPVLKPAKSYLIPAPKLSVLWKTWSSVKKSVLKDRFKSALVLSDVNATLSKKGIKWAWNKEATWMPHTFVKLDWWAGQTDSVGWLKYLQMQYWILLLLDRTYILQSVSKWNKFWNKMWRFYIFKTLSMTIKDLLNL